MNRYTIEVRLCDISAKQSFIGIKSVCDKTGYSDTTIQSWFHNNPKNVYNINGFTIIRRERNEARRNE